MTPGPTTLGADPRASSHSHTTPRNQVQPRSQARAGTPLRATAEDRPGTRPAARPDVRPGTQVAARSNVPAASSAVAVSSSGSPARPPVTKAKLDFPVPKAEASTKAHIWDRVSPVATAAKASTRAADTTFSPSQSPADMIDIFTGDPNFMTSLARGLSVIQAFTQHTPRMTISQVSARTGLSRAAVRRCLYTLNKLGFVGTEDGQRFSLRPRILSLSHSYTSSSSLAHAAQPVLDQVSHQLNESCSVATLDGDEIVYIARANVTRIMAVDLVIGSRLPAYCTSMGRILLANLLPDDLEKYLARVALHRYTRRSITSVDKLRVVLRNIQRTGFAMVDQELELGLRSLAVPVKSSTGKVIAAMNVGAQAQRMPLHEVQTHFLLHLQAAAHQLSLTLR